MNRKELTYRLSVLGMKKQDFAALLGMAPDTLYQWEEVPQYALALLVATEQIRALDEEVKRLMKQNAATRLEAAATIAKGRKK